MYFTTINQINSKHISLHPGSNREEGVEVMWGIPRNGAKFPETF